MGQILNRRKQRQLETQNAKITGKKKQTQLERELFKIPRIEIQLGALEKDVKSLNSDVDKLKPVLLDSDDNLLGGVIEVNGSVLQQSVAMASGENGVVVGPLTIPLGKRLKINEGARLVIL